MRPLVVLAAVSSAGCFSLNARVAAGPVLETDGNVGYQVVASAGFGYATEESGYVGRIGVATSNRADFGMSSDLAYARVREELVASFGFGTESLTTSEVGTVYLSAAALRPVMFSSSRSFSGNRKFGFDSASTKALGIGLEGRAGMLIGPDVETKGLFSVMAAVDYIGLFTLD